jgi:hypothetical protein
MFNSEAFHCRECLAKCIENLCHRRYLPVKVPAFNRYIKRHTCWLHRKISKQQGKRGESLEILMYAPVCPPRKESDDEYSNNIYFITCSNKVHKSLEKKYLVTEIECE